MTGGKSRKSGGVSKALIRRLTEAKNRESLVKDNKSKKVKKRKNRNKQMTPFEFSK